MSVALELREAAEVMGARLVGAGPGFHGVSTDSRKVRPGSLFVALRGTRTDGHDHVASAFAGGAVAALVERELSGVGPLLVVDDAVAGLGRLAAGWRARHDLPLIGITGSTGKTTVKEMAAAILGRRGPVLATRGNLNNHIAWRGPASAWSPMPGRCTSRASARWPAWRAPRASCSPPSAPAVRR
jgi:UDP-N-acetylmuramoyl-tripeptide--D-alanyl-D-alanine ligase